MKQTSWLRTQRFIVSAMVSEGMNKYNCTSCKYVGDASLYQVRNLKHGVDWSTARNGKQWKRKHLNVLTSYVSNSLLVQPLIISFELFVYFRFVDQRVQNVQHAVDVPDLSSCHVKVLTIIKSYIIAQWAKHWQEDGLLHWL